jgi:hypothetical protein
MGVFGFGVTLFLFFGVLFLGVTTSDILKVEDSLTLRDKSFVISL